jgi:hypothetical protein
MCQWECESRAVLEKFLRRCSAVFGKEERQHRARSTWVKQEQRTAPRGLPERPNLEFVHTASLLEGFLRVRTK